MARVSLVKSGISSGPWAVRLHIELDIFAAAHVNDFVIDAERLPTAVGSLVVAFAVELSRCRDPARRRRAR